MIGIARLVLVPAGLLWLMHVASMQGVAHSAPDRLLLLLALVANELCLVLFAWRMRVLLAVYEVHLRWRDAFRIHLQSMFYFFIVPMTVGVEIARFAKIRALNAGVSKSQMVSALILDRMVGAGMAALIALVMLPFMHVRGLPVKPKVVVLIVLVFCLAGVSALWFPAVRRRIATVSMAPMRQLPRAVTACVLAVCTHAMFALSVFLAAKALNIAIAYPAVLFAVAAGLLLIVVPLSVGGLGPADVGVAAIIFALGYSWPNAALIAALPYFARLFAAVQGAAWETAGGGLAAVAATRALMARAETPP